MTYKQYLFNWQDLSYEEKFELGDWFYSNPSTYDWYQYHKDDNTGHIWLEVHFKSKQAAMWFKLKWAAR